MLHIFISNNGHDPYHLAYFEGRPKASKFGYEAYLPRENEVYHSLNMIFLIEQSVIRVLAAQDTIVYRTFHIHIILWTYVPAFAKLFLKVIYVHLIMFIDTYGSFNGSYFCPLDIVILQVPANCQSSHNTFFSQIPNS